MYFQIWKLSNYLLNWKWALQSTQTLATPLKAEEEKNIRVRAPNKKVEKRKRKIKRERKSAAQQYSLSAKKYVLKKNEKARTSKKEKAEILVSSSAMWVTDYCKNRLKNSSKMLTKNRVQIFVLILIQLVALCKANTHSALRDVHFTEDYSVNELPPSIDGKPLQVWTYESNLKPEDSNIN